MLTWRTTRGVNLTELIISETWRESFKYVLVRASPADAWPDTSEQESFSSAAFMTRAAMRRTGLELRLGHSSHASEQATEYFFPPEKKIFLSYTIVYRELTQSSNKNRSVTSAPLSKYRIALHQNKADFHRSCKDSALLEINLLRVAVGA